MNNTLLPPTPQFRGCSIASPDTSLAAARRSAFNAKQFKLMVVDDEPTNVKLVRRLLELQGYERFITTTDSREALGLIESEQPDCVLMDLMMPYLSGVDVLRAVRSAPELEHIPVIVLTAIADRPTRCQVLAEGATDFLTKPIDPAELGPRVSNILAVKGYQDQLLRYNHDLEKAVRERTTQLEQAHRQVALCLATAAEYRDNDTGLHVIRVGRYARLIGEELGIVNDQADLLEDAAQLHDVGKIGVPDAILLKPGRLSAEEFEVLKKHCNFGDRILRTEAAEPNRPLQRTAPDEGAACRLAASSLLAMASRIALSHHEWWDGSGYPRGLAGEEIPLEGRITAVADVFDALSSKRCYKDAFPLDECFEIMKQERGTHFDPAVFDAFTARREALLEVRMRYADEE
jgi:putative two-component system response regulator